MLHRVLISVVCCLFVVVRLSITHALPMPEFERITLRNPFIVTAIGAEAGQGEVHPAVKFEFILRNKKCRATLIGAFSLMPTPEDLSGHGI